MYVYFRSQRESETECAAVQMKNAVAIAESSVLHKFAAKFFAPLFLLWTVKFIAREARNSLKLFQLAVMPSRMFPRACKA